MSGRETRPWTKAMAGGSAWTVERSEARGPRQGRAAVRTAVALGASGMFVLCAAAPTAAQSGREAVREGNELYEQGRFEEALERYLEALRENPESPLIRFNAGNALYQNQDFQRALDSYREAIESGDPALQSSAWYNLGNALYRAQELEASGEAYKQALRLDPSDGDAKHNLERVLQEQQQQQGQDGEESEDPGDEEQEGGQPQPRPGQEDPEQGEDEPQDGQPGEQRGQPDQPGDPEEDPDREGEQPGEQPPEGPEQEGQGQARPLDGDMTPEEARRLLEAVDENPEDVNRRQGTPLGRRPRKDW